MLKMNHMHTMQGARATTKLRSRTVDNWDATRTLDSSLAPYMGRMGGITKLELAFAPADTNSVVTANKQFDQDVCLLAHLPHLRLLKVQG